MGIDFGELTGFIVIASSAAVLGLSYVAAYLMGKNAARKEMDRRDVREMLGTARQPDRLERIESAVDTIAQEVERLSEAQRFLFGTRGTDRAPQPSSAKPDRRHATPV